MANSNKHSCHYITSAYLLLKPADRTGSKEEEKGQAKRKGGVELGWKAGGKEEDRRAGKRQAKKEKERKRRRRGRKEKTRPSNHATCTIPATLGLEKEQKTRRQKKEEEKTGQEEKPWVEKWANGGKGGIPPWVDGVCLPSSLPSPCLRTFLQT